MTANDLGIFMRASRDNQFHNITIHNSHHFGVFMAHAEQFIAGVLQAAPETECTQNSFTNLIAKNCGRAAFRVNNSTCTNNVIIRPGFAWSMKGGLSLARPDLVTCAIILHHPTSAGYCRFSQFEIGIRADIRIVWTRNFFQTILWPRKSRLQNFTGGPVSRFIQHHYRHFNAASLVDAAKGYVAHLDNGGKMMITLGGAMSTAELGLSLAEMIRQDKVHLITCTGANLEEDVFNLVAHDYYERVPHYRYVYRRGRAGVARTAT